MLPYLGPWPSPPFPSQDRHGPEPGPPTRVVYEAAGGLSPTRSALLLDRFLIGTWPSLRHCGSVPRSVASLLWSQVSPTDTSDARPGWAASHWSCPVATVSVSKSCTKTTGGLEGPRAMKNVLGLFHLYPTRADASGGSTGCWWVGHRRVAAC